MRLSYQSARILYRNGLRFKEPEVYKGNLRHEFDVELFIKFVEEDKEVESYRVFFKKIEEEREEWHRKDLVLDPNETWKQLFKRTFNFEEPNMIPREEVPEEK